MLRDAKHASRREYEVLRREEGGRREGGGKEEGRRREGGREEGGRREWILIF